MVTKKNKKKIMRRSPNLNSDLIKRNIIVLNIDYQIDEDILSDSFEKYGVVNSVNIIKDSKGNSKGMATVLMENERSAIDAVQQQHGKKINRCKTWVNRGIITS